MHKFIHTRHDEYLPLLEWNATTALQMIRGLMEAYEPLRIDACLSVQQETII
jgi:hypothetical protein